MLKILMVTLAAICLVSCEGSNSGDLIKDAGKDPFTALFLPLALPGAMIADVLSAPFSGGKSSGSGAPAGGLSPTDALALGSAAMGVASPGGNGASIPSAAARTSSGGNMCQQLYSKAQQCLQSWRGLGGGGSGQAGSFKQCYDNYMGAYRASC